MHKKIGLTGRIGAGKTTVREIFATLPDVITFDCDTIAKDILRAPEHQKSIESIFGADIFDGDTINTTRVAEIIFTDAAKKITLENFLHPRVFAEIDHALQATSAKIAIIESAIIYDNCLEKNFESIILVTAPEHVRHERLVHRDMSEADITHREKNALSTDTLKIRADYVIDANCARSALEQNIHSVYKKIIAQ